MSRLPIALALALASLLGCGGDNDKPPPDEATGERASCAGPLQTVAVETSGTCGPLPGPRLFADGFPDACEGMVNAEVDAVAIDMTCPNADGSRAHLEGRVSTQRATGAYRVELRDAGGALLCASTYDVVGCR